MKNLVWISLLLASAIAQAAPVEITHLSSASSGGFFSRALNYSYLSGGCGPDGNQVSYRLEVLERSKRVSESGFNFVHAKVKIHISEDKGGACRMAYVVNKSIDTEQLLLEHAKDLGLDLTAKNTSVTVSFELPPVGSDASILSQ